ncbi:MAG: hypothetical protein JWL79_756 [Frankiales bacterium]|nr:hypothetical protein [Frankiales bacterium]
MRTTTKRAIAVGSCVAAFALPQLATGTASAAGRPVPHKLVHSSVSDNSMYTYGPESGVTAKIASALTSSTTLTGSSYGADGGDTTVRVISHFGPRTAYSTSGTDGNTTWTEVGKTAEGVIITLTKTAGTTVITRYNATSDCGKYTESTTSNSGELLRAAGAVRLTSTTTSEQSYCYAYGGGFYFAKGAAVSNGLPASGRSYFDAYTYKVVNSTDGVPFQNYGYSGLCQSFNDRYSGCEA